MSARSTQSSGGIGFVGLLTILFVGLKLTGFINWSWWWVLSPIWITALITVIIIVVVLIVAIIDVQRKNNEMKRR